MTIDEIYKAMQKQTTLNYCDRPVQVHSLSNHEVVLKYTDGGGGTRVNTAEIKTVIKEWRSAWCDRPFVKYERDNQDYYSAEAVDVFFEKYEPEFRRIPSK